MTLLEDPYLPAEFGGDEEELTVVSGLVKAHAELNQGVRVSHFFGADGAAITARRASRPKTTTRLLIGDWFLSEEI